MFYRINGYYVQVRVYQNACCRVSFEIPLKFRTLVVMRFSILNAPAAVVGSFSIMRGEIPWWSFSKAEKREISLRIVFWDMYHVCVCL